MILDSGCVCSSLPVPTAHGVFFSLSLPLPTAQKVLASFSLPLPAAEREPASSHRIPIQHSPTQHGFALDEAGMPTMPAPLVTNHRRACWTFDFPWKCMPKPAAALFEHLTFFPLYDLLHHFVVTMQTFFCVCFVGYLPPHYIITLLRHDLQRDLYFKHDFFALTGRLLRNLPFLCQNFAWLPVGRYLVKARCSKSLGCAMPRLRFKRSRLSPVSVNKMICLLGPLLIAATAAPASRYAQRQGSLGGGTSSQTYSLAQLSEHLAVGSLEQEKDSVFRYVAQVEDVDLLKYPSPAYIHCKIPLEYLITLLPVTHAQKIATRHGLSPGSRCTQKDLLMCIENHSCLRCNLCLLCSQLKKAQGT